MSQQVTLPLDIQLEERVEVRERLLKTAVTRVHLQRLAMRGLNATEAAGRLGISPATARSHYADPDFKREVITKVNSALGGVDDAFEKQTQTLYERLEEQAAKSFDELLLLAETESLHPALKVKIHQDFLNRVEDTKPLSGSSHKVDAQWLHRAAGVAKEMDNVIPMRRTG